MSRSTWTVPRVGEPYINTTDYYYYDGNRVVEEWRDEGSGLDRRRQYVWGLDYIDEPVAQTNAPEETGDPTVTYFVLTDANYNVVALTDTSGALAEQYSYTPYGELFDAEQDHDNFDGTFADITQLTGPNAAVLTNLGHQGLWREFLVDVYHNRAREYFFLLGRFAQEDPFGTRYFAYGASAPYARPPRLGRPSCARSQYRDGLNLYAYLRNNPPVGQDPSGLWKANIKMEEKCPATLKQRDGTAFNLEDVVRAAVQKECDAFKRAANALAGVDSHDCVMRCLAKKRNYTKPLPGSPSASRMTEIIYALKWQFCNDLIPKEFQCRTNKESGTCAKGVRDGPRSTGMYTKEGVVLGRRPGGGDRYLTSRRFYGQPITLCTDNIVARGTISSFMNHEMLRQIDELAEGGHVDKYGINEVVDPHVA